MQLALSLSFELFVASIAIRCVSGVLALADPNRFAFICLEDIGNKAGAFMRSIAQRTVGRLAAGAIGIVFTGFQFDLFRKTSGDFWLIHKNFMLKFEDLM
jgi:hypothetical protein